MTDYFSNLAASRSRPSPDVQRDRRRMGLASEVEEITAPLGETDQRVADVGKHVGYPNGEVPAGFFEAFQSAPDRRPSATPTRASRSRA